MVTFDVALRRDDEHWLEELPPEIADQLATCSYYGHFFCHVLHQHHVAKDGVDTVALEKRMTALLEERGAKIPAEHNYGQLYECPGRWKRISSGSIRSTFSTPASVAPRRARTGPDSASSNWRRQPPLQQRREERTGYRARGDAGRRVSCAISVPGRISADAGRCAERRWPSGGRLPSSG